MPIRRYRYALLAVAGLAGLAAVAGPRLRVPRTQGPLRHEAYVWQREWTPAVNAAVRDAAPRLSGLVALGAEIAWRRGRIEIARVALDPARLAGAGVALRIGPYPGPFAADDAVTRRIADLADSLVAELHPHELQIDFDCAESQLDGYRLWVEAIRRHVAPTPTVVTALPSWLDRPGFGNNRRREPPPSRHWRQDRASATTE